MLDDLGLEATLRWYIGEFKERTQIDVDYTIPKLNKRYPLDIEISLYRIIQEALTNIVKHSSADKVKINISESNKIVSINIKDNGKGFLVEKAFNPETRGISFGILGMRERVRNLGGDFNIKSEINLGTQLELSIPITI